jgi:hypothetical protein
LVGFRVAFSVDEIVRFEKQDYGTMIVFRAERSEGKRAAIGKADKDVGVRFASWPAASEQEAIDRRAN